MQKCLQGSEEERKVYRLHERRAHEMKAVAGGLEVWRTQMIPEILPQAPAQIVTVLYLILRGLLPLPWLEPASEACLQVPTSS